MRTAFLKFEDILIAVFKQAGGILNIPDTSLLSVSRNSFRGYSKYLRSFARAERFICVHGSFVFNYLLKCQAKSEKKERGA